MQMAASVFPRESPGIVYGVACQNFGCGHTFDLPITAKQVGMLASTIACPRCTRPAECLSQPGAWATDCFRPS